MEREFLKKPEITAMKESPRASEEKRKEYRDCIINKIAELVKAFDKDVETKDEGLIGKIDEFNSLIENTHFDITGDSHLAHTIVNLLQITTFVERRENLRNGLENAKSDDEKKEIEKKISLCDKPIAEAKQALLRYIIMCLKDEDFLKLELSKKRGFWEDKAIAIDKKDVGETIVGIAEMDVKQFVNYSWEHFKNDKISAEELDLAA